MDNRTPCPICRTQNTVHSGASANTFEVNCPRCGRFQIQTLAETQLMNSPPAFPPQHLLSGLCRNTWDILGEKLLVTVDLFKSWAELDKAAKIVVPRDTDLVTKGDYLLKYLRRRSRSLADTVVFSPAELSVGFCSNRNELLFCLRYLADKGLVEEAGGRQHKNPAGGGGVSYRLTPAGWAALTDPAPSGQPLAVISLALERESDAVWTQGHSAGVQAAGYMSVRAENKERANKITDELIVDLRRASLVVADLTEQNPLTYFAAGLVTGLGKPVFWTCEEGEARDKKLWLEVRQYVVTTWTVVRGDDFSRRLAQRIEATLGRP